MLGQILPARLILALDSFVMRMEVTNHSEGLSVGEGLGIPRLPVFIEERV